MKTDKTICEACVEGTMISISMDCDGDLKEIRTLASDLVQQITGRCVRSYERGVICVYCRACHGGAVSGESKRHGLVYAGQSLKGEGQILEYHGDRCELSSVCCVSDCECGELGSSCYTSHCERCTLERVSRCTCACQGHPLKCHPDEVQERVSPSFMTCAFTQPGKVPSCDTNLNVPCEAQTATSRCDVRGSGRADSDVDDVIGLCDTFMVPLFAGVNGGTDRRRKPRVPQSKKSAKKARKEKIMRKKLKGFPVSDEPAPTYEEMGFWTEAELATPVDSCLLCAVCMELYYKPHSCLPCEHVFCEPCLRRLAKYNADNRMPSVCPICRREINHCVPDQVMEVQVRTLHYHNYNKRHKFEGKGKYMAYPLPSKTLKVRKRDVLNALVNRQRMAPHERFVNHPCMGRLLFILLWVVILVLVLFMVSKILWLYKNDFYLTNLYVEFCEKLWNYNSLEYDVKIAVTNQAVVFLSVVTMLSCVIYVLL